MTFASTLFKTFWLVFLLLGVIQAQNPAGQPPAEPAKSDFVVEATGYGVSENAASLAARREALAIGIGQMLTSQTEVENFMVKKDLVITRTMGNVKKFDILSKEQGPDGAWKVTIRAVVSKDGIAQDLAALNILRMSIGNPRIAMLITENNIGNEDPTAGKTEAILIDHFRSRDFEVVDPSNALKYRESAEGMAALGGDPEAAAKLGSMLNAEVIIVGKVVAKAADVSAIPALANSGMKSASANVSLKAVNVSTRQIMAAKTIDAPAVHIAQHTAGSRAIEAAVKKLLNEDSGFFNTLIKSWKHSAVDGSVYQLTIGNVKSFQHLKAVKTNLEPKVQSMQQRSYAKPLLKLDVTFTGSVDDLCEVLDGLDLGGAVLTVDGFQGNSITLTAAKK